MCGIVTPVGAAAEEAGNFKAGVSRIVRNAVTAQEFLPTKRTISNLKCCPFFFVALLLVLWFCVAGSGLRQRL